jgi:hypothetical protein
MEQLQQLGCECNKVDMVNGVFEQDLIRVYTRYLSNGNFTISSTGQYQPADKLTEMGLFAQSTISPGPIKNLTGIRVPQTVEEMEVFSHPDRNFSIDVG